MNGCIWGVGGMKLIRESRSIRSKSCPIVTLSNKIPTWTGLELNLFVRAERLATNRPNYDAAAILFNFCEDMYVFIGVMMWTGCCCKCGNVYLRMTQEADYRPRKRILPHRDS
jgi:hypothetical protein